MDIDKYINDRVNPQIEWYDSKSLHCQKIYKIIQISEIILAATIPLLSGYSSYSPLIPFVIGLIGVIITIIESINKLNKYHESWIEYRSTCELLKYQKFLYTTKTAPYNSEIETIENVFIRNIEQIVSSENNQWKNINVNDEQRKPKTSD